MKKGKGGEGKRGEGQGAEGRKDRRTGYQETHQGITTIDPKGYMALGHRYSVSKL